MENMTKDQINTINMALKAYPSQQFFQGLSRLGAQIYSITQSLGAHAKLGMTSVSLARHNPFKQSMRNDFHSL